MKKLQPGGTIDRDALNDQFEKELLGYNLKAKDLRKVREKFVELTDYLADPTGKSFSADPLAQRFSISGEGAEKFEGSPDEIKSNWLTGKYKLKDDQDVTSIAASIYANVMKNKGATATGTPTSGTMSSTPSTTASKYEINTLDDYLANEYKTSGNIEDILRSLDTDDKRKDKIYSWAQTLVGNYRKKLADNPTSLMGSDLDKLDLVEAAIANKDWEAFKENSFKLGWEPQKYLLNDSDKARIETEEATKVADTSGKMFDEMGIHDPTFRQQLIALGYTQKAADDWSPIEGATWWNDLLRENNAYAVYNPEKDKYMTIRKDGVFDFGVQKEFSPGYGYSWKNDAYGGLEVFTPDKYKSNTAVQWEADPNADKNIGVELITNLPGAKVTGWSMQNKDTGKYKQDVLGKRDFTHQLEVEDQSGKYNIYKGQDGKYRKENGEIVDIQITGFGEQRKEITDYTQMFRDIPDPEKNKRYDDLAEVLPRIEKLIKDNEISSTYTKKAATLKWALYYDPRVKNNKQLKERIKNALAGYDDMIKRSKAVAPAMKKGGIIRAQKGISFNDYVKKYKNQPTEQSQASTEAPRDISGSMKGQSGLENTLDAVSTAGALSSFIPGVGAIGAGVSLGADLAKDLSDGKVDNWGNHALNLAFVGLSFVGLGGIKSLLKVGKMADKGMDIAKIVKKSAKVNLSAVEKEALETLSKVAQKEGIKTASQVAGKSLKLSAADTKLLEKGLEVAEIVKNSSTSKLGASALGTVIKSGKNAMPSLQKTLGNKYVLGGLRAATILPGAGSALEVGKNLEVFGGDGIEYAKMQDIKNVALAGAVGKNWLKDARGIKALKNQAMPQAGKDQTFLNAEKFKGLEKVDLTDVKVAKDSKSILGWDKKKINLKNEENLKKFREDIKGALKKQGVDVTKYKELDEVVPADLRYAKASTPNEIIIGDAAKPTKGGDRFKDTQDYNLAKEYLKKFNIKYKTESEIFNPKKIPVFATSKRLKNLEDMEKVKSRNESVQKDWNTRKEKLAKLKEEGKKAAPKKKVEKPEKVEKAKTPKTPKVPKNKLGGILKAQGGTTLKSTPQVPKAKTFNLNDYLDKTDMLNIGMYANTAVANRRSRDAQNRAVSESQFRLSGVPQKNFRATSPTSIFAEKEAAKFQNMTERSARSTSDFDKGIAARLAGATKANEFRTNAQLADQGRIDELKRTKDADDYNRIATNLDIDNKNKAMTAQSNQQLNLIRSSDALARGTNLNLLSTGINQNIPMKEFRKNNKALYDFQFDPDFQASLESVNKLKSEEGKKEYYDKWFNSQDRTSGKTKAWVDSDQYKEWLNKIKEAEEVVKPKIAEWERIRTLQSLNLPLIYSKRSGGSLTKGERIDIENVKHKNKMELKKYELIHKQLLHSQEMLQKALIKVFK